MRMNELDLKGGRVSDPLDLLPPSRPKRVYRTVALATPMTTSPHGTGRARITYLGAHCFTAHGSHWLSWAFFHPNRKRCGYSTAAE